MLQTMRNNAQGMIAKVIVGFIIVVFALFGVESIVNLGGGEQPVAKVGDYEIFKADVQNKVAEQKAQLRQQFGEQYDESLFNEQLLEQSALEQLVNEKVAQTQADEMGLYASTAVIDQMIMNTPSFQSGGQFDAEQFKLILRMNNMSVLQYRALLADSIKQNQMRSAFMLSTIETPFSVKQQQALDNEQREYSFATFESSAFKANVELSEEEIETAYQENLDRYRNPEKVKVKYVLLAKDTFVGEQEVTEEDLDIAYSDFAQAEEAKEQREASHILFDTSSRSESDAIALAEEAIARINGGESFADVAKDMSDDSGSADMGGSLGINARGAFDPAFDDALFALEEGNISQPVVSEFGVHVIKASKVVAAKVPSLDDVRDQLTAAVKAEKAGFLLAERNQELANTAFSAETIEEVASASGLTVQETDLFSLASGVGVAANDSVRRAAFEDNMKLDREVSDLIETAEGSVVFSVSDYVEAKAKPLEEVRAQIVSRLTNQKALELAKADAEAAKESGDATWSQASGTVRQATDAPRAVHQKAFSLVVGETELVSTTTGFAVVRVDSIDQKSWEEMAVTEELSASVRNQNARDDMISFQAWSKANTTIK
jgi:peptidyl-prolyl cis-trans isomerase D